MKVTTDACLFGAWCAMALGATTGNETLLDIGTGTGLLSLLIRQKNSVTIDAVEIDAGAATQAAQNVAASPWKKDIQVANADVLHMDILKRYDYIISNPPFYETDLQSRDPKRNTAHHSRQLAMQPLLAFIKKNLKNTGAFFLLLPYKRRDEVQALIRSADLYIHKETAVRHTDQHAPFRMMLKGGLSKKEHERSTITITGTEKRYTPEFTTLLSDYYLYL